MISQAKGLAQQFSKNIMQINTKLIFPWSKLQPGLLPIFSWIFLNNLDFKTKPDIIISCGRKSVYLSLYLKKKYKDSITIHIQNPKINFKSFDYIIAPNHDLINGPNVINSIGALHKFTDEIIQKEKDNDFTIPKKNLFSVIIGGDNNHYKFSKNEIKRLIQKIIFIKKEYSEINFLIIDSRRTRNEIKKIIKKELHELTYFWNVNEKNPYCFALKHSQFFIITSDSTSMISECAFTGKPIFVFHLPFKRTSKRIENFHEEFENRNITKKLLDNTKLVPWSYKTLNEAERIAGIIKKRIIKDVQ